MIACQCARSAIPAGQACGPNTTPGVSSGVALPVPALSAVRCGVGVIPVLLEPLLQAANTGIRKSNARRPPINRRLACGGDVRITMYPSVDQDRHARRDIIEVII